MIESEVRKHDYAGTGVQVTFPFTYKAWAAADVKVTLTTAEGAKAPQVQDTQYSVILLPGGGGSVVMVTPPALGEALRVESDLDYKQGHDYTAADQFPADSHEEALDREVMLAQQVRDRVEEVAALVEGGAPLVTPGYGAEVIVAAKYGPPGPATWDFAKALAGVQEWTIVLGPGQWGRPTADPLDNITTRAERGAQIDPGATDLTLARFEAGFYQVFYPSGAGKILFGSPTCGPGAAVKILAEWTGCLSDNSTDNATALAALSTIANASVSGNYKPQVYFGPGLGYLSSSAISFGKDVEVVMDSPLIYTGAAENITFLTLGEAGDTTSRSNEMHHKIMVVRQATSGWSDETGVGVKLINQYNGFINIAKVQGFCVGVSFTGNGFGAAYNKVFLGRLYDNKLVLDLDAIASGWVNENNFYSGNFQWTTGYLTGTKRIGVRITSSDASYLINNNNKFFGPSFDGGGSTDEDCFLIVHGKYNRAWGVRGENMNTGLRVQNASKNNHIEFGYDPTTPIVDETTSGNSNNIVSTIEGIARDQSQRLLWSIPDVLAVMTYYTPATPNYRVDGCSFLDSGGATKYEARGSGITPYHVNGYLKLTASAALGVKVDTSLIKRLLITRNVVTNGGRILIQCFDSDGAVLGGGATVYAKGNSISWSASYGGAYRSPTDSTLPIWVWLHDDVKSIWVGVNGGTAAVNLKGFAIYTSAPYSANVVSGHGNDQRRGLWAVAIPSLGLNHVIGTIVGNAAAASGQPSYWQCTTSGGYATAWAPGTGYSVDDVVLNDTNKIYVCVTAGTSAGAGGPTGTGAGIVDNTVVWDYYSPLAVHQVGPSLP